jgi:hypothetical protein
MVSPSLSLFSISEKGRYDSMSDPQKVTIWLVPANVPLFPLVFSNRCWYWFSVIIGYARFCRLDLEIFCNCGVWTFRRATHLYAQIELYARLEAGIRLQFILSFSCRNPGFQGDRRIAEAGTTIGFTESPTAERQASRVVWRWRLGIEWCISPLRTGDVAITLLILRSSRSAAPSSSRLKTNFATTCICNARMCSSR